MDSVVSPPHRHHDGPARRPRRARPRGPLDPLRGPRAAARRDPQPRARAGDRAHAGAVRRADQARARHARGSPRSARRASPSPAPSRRSARRSCTRPSSRPASTCSSSAARRSRPSTSRRSSEPLNLKKFIYELDVPVIVGGAATYTAALHLMRTGAAGVLVGFGGGAASTTRATLGIHAPMATAVADVAGARRDYLDESGGRYVHVIADGGVGTSGDIVKAIACGADAVMLGVGARPRDRRPRRRLPLGRRGAPPASCRAASACSVGPGRARSRRSSTARRPSPTARRTSSARSAVDGDHRLLRPQGVPARRGRRAPYRRLSLGRPRPTPGRLRTPRVA